MPTQGRADRLHDVRFVTAHYEMLQGYAVLPGFLAIAFLFTTLSDSISWFTGAGWTVAALVLLGLATYLAVPIARWYRHTYGELVPQRPPGRWSAAAFVVALLVTLVIGRAAAWVSDGELLVSPEAITASVFAIGAGLFVRLLRPAFLAVGLVGLGLGVMPLGSWLGTGTHPLSETELLLVTVALGTAVVAIWSHISLKRTLSRDHVIA